MWCCTSLNFLLLKYLDILRTTTVWLPIRREKNIKSQRKALLEYLHCDFIRSLKPSWLTWWYWCQEGLGLFSNMAGFSLQKPLIRSMLETVLLCKPQLLGTGSQLYFSSWPVARLNLLPCVYRCCLCSGRCLGRTLSLTAAPESSTSLHSTCRFVDLSEQ